MEGRRLPFRETNLDDVQLGAYNNNENFGAEREHRFVQMVGARVAARMAAYEESHLMPIIDAMDRKIACLNHACRELESKLRALTVDAAAAHVTVERDLEDLKKRIKIGLVAVGSCVSAWAGLWLVKYLRH